MIFGRLPKAVVLGPLLFFMILFLLVGVTKGIIFQWDIGNFVAGLGTLSLAAVTYLSVKASESAKMLELSKLSNLEIAKFRLEWNKDLRLAISKYVSTHRLVSQYQESVQKDKQKGEKLLYDLQESRNVILLMIKEDSDLQEERDLCNLIEISEFEDRQKEADIRSEIRKIGRVVLNKTWKQAKFEIKEAHQKQE